MLKTYIELVAKNILWLGQSLHYRTVEVVGYYNKLSTICW